MFAPRIFVCAEQRRFRPPYLVRNSLSSLRPNKVAAGYGPSPPAQATKKGGTEVPPIDFELLEVS
jgi:hypothetical protein